MGTKIRIFDNATDTRTYAAGETIFAEGEHGDRMYIIREGEVELIQKGQLLYVLDQGEVFGEMALIDSQPRSAAAVARTDVVVVEVDIKRFDTMVQITPNFARTIMKILAERLRERPNLVQ